MKLGVSSRLQILTNDVQVLILCLSYSVTTVQFTFNKDCFVSIVFRFCLEFGRIKKWKDSGLQEVFRWRMIGRFLWSDSKLHFSQPNADKDFLF